MFNNLLSHFRKYVQLTAEEESVVQAFVTYKTLKKKEYLLKEGEVCTGNYFVLKGCLRMYFIQENGAEQIMQFALENWWLSDYLSYGQQTPSFFSIQAIEDTEVAVIEYCTQKAILQKVPTLEEYFRKMLERGYGAMQYKLYYQYAQTGEERYHFFNNSFPGFVQRIPQYMLASFLGFTPEFLSKIRAKKK